MVTQRQPHGLVPILGKELRFDVMLLYGLLSRRRRTRHGILPQPIKFLVRYVEARAGTIEHLFRKVCPPPAAGRSGRISSTGNAIALGHKGIQAPRHDIAAHAGIVQCCLPLFRGRIRCLRIDRLTATNDARQAR